MFERGFRARGRPFDIALGRGIGQDKPTRGISTESRDDVQRINDVVLGFRHLRRRDDIHFRAVFLEKRFAVFQIDLLGIVINRTSILPVAFINRVRHHALREQSIERFNRFAGKFPVIFIARAKKRE